MATQKMHLRDLVRALGWSYGALWSMPHPNTALVFADGSFEADPLKKYAPEYSQVDRLFKCSYETCEFPLGSGYVGKVLQERQPLWLNGTDFLVHHRNTASQAHFFKVAGIQTLLCIPWFDCVVELGSSSLLPEDATLLPQIFSFLSHVATSTSKQRRTKAQSSLEDSFTSQDLSGGSDDASFNGGLSRDQQVESCSSLGKISQSNHNRTTAAEHDVGHGEVVAASGESEWRLEIASSDTAKYQANLASFQSPSSSFSEQGLQEEGNQDAEFDSSFLMGPRQRMSLLSQVEFNNTHSMSTSHSSSRDNDTNDLLRVSNANTEQQSEDDQYPPGESGFTVWNATTARNRSVAAGVQRGSSSHSNQVVLRRCINMALKIPQMKALRARQEGSAAAVRQRPAAIAAEEVLLGHDDAAVNHKLAERRRRQKHKENFSALGALIPFVTKTDRASILGDAICYLKKLNSRVEELELLNRELEAQLPETQRKRSRSSITSL